MGARAWPRTLFATGLALLALGPLAEFSVAEDASELLQAMVVEHRLTPEQTIALARELNRHSGIWSIARSVAQNPVSEAQCRAEVLNAGLLPRRTQDEETCGRTYMVPIPDGSGRQARICVDQFEFPNLPCRYPLTWVRPVDAQRMCAAMGRRLCDANEWEGACTGSLEPMRFDQDRETHNRTRSVTYAYGQRRRGDICGFGAPKSDTCDEALRTGRNIVRACAPNHYPTGYFPRCVSPIGVYDLHGNAAEHMNLPTNADETGRRGGAGVTEMKGSWFFFPRTEEARFHPDDCRWREPGWHRTRVDDPAGHMNYHLGFRCCADIGR